MSQYSTLRLVIAALAAVGMTLVVFALRERAQRPVEPTLDRSGPAAVADMILAQTASCSRADCRLAWSGAPGQEFRLRVLTEDLEILQDVDLLDANSFEVSAADLARVRSGDGLLWQVMGQNAEGQTMRSPTYREDLQ